MTDYWKNNLRRAISYSCWTKGTGSCPERIWVQCRCIKCLERQPVGFADGGNILSLAEFSQHACSQPPSLKLFTIVHPGTPNNPVPLLDWLRAANEHMGGEKLVRRQLCSSRSSNNYSHHATGAKTRRSRGVPYVFPDVLLATQSGPRQRNGVSVRATAASAARPCSVPVSNILGPTVNSTAAIFSAG
ncbi:hypothetical protein VOLCADRAFT_91077 [Volvox carteri f. nagariensis]|uniref:Uncharacterized protein n=1 Tax=Volvox carteri f. nagariensis TaxID=3068 RepID=D8TW43_VOLCA|nr:uncharacterized protein VOLCADRAFT_91077 [Volvox carteri f. nagariensis]EFJ48413.1 hypothetical protein VOLCADRAFT_91077 [Volvox carteri f. nagariensis]|eukprot:XP_002950667.1 hypothetical protein VOLCADRAFT_91077 [Volvox carteri f. nagariensis]